MKVLVAGDSFAVRKNTNHDNTGWPQLLAQEYQITNVAQAGVSEYKIIKQLQSQTLDEFDALVVVHTSPFRVHVQTHALHTTSPTHQYCDLIYQDLLSSDSTQPQILAALGYFQYIFDTEYYLDLYKMFLSTCNYMTKNHNVLHVSFFNNQIHTPFTEFRCLHEVFNKHPGSVNHLSKIGNLSTYRIINTWLQNPNY